MKLWFDFHDPAGEPRHAHFSDPLELLVARSLDEVRPALRAAEQALGRGRYVAGYLAYEAAPAFDPALEVCSPGELPLLWLGVFDQPRPAPPPGRSGGYRLSAWSPAISRADYARSVAEVRAAIARGETYQVNLTTRLHARFSGDAGALYRRLAEAQRACYGAYLDLGRYKLVSASPELFFYRLGDRLLVRPMKGTARRGRWPAEDGAQAAWLAASQKNQAENLMIVDLLRNDLGRVARVGSVRVPELFKIERYPTIFQMTSTVTAEALPGLGLEQLLAALFPCGSVTGAPKASTMRLIRQLEGRPRGLYCGAIGFVTPGGEALFNVAIRTATIDTQTGLAEYGAGGGVTWDSTAEEEYAELLDKAALLTEPQPVFRLLETLLLQDGAYALLERHLWRLAESAAYFDIPLSVEQARLALESEPLRPLPAGPLPVALGTTPVSRWDRMLFHKTTLRDTYDRQRAAHPQAFDTLMRNAEGELTEFTIGNLVVELDGRRWTPPLECGLLPGTLRAELLARGEIAERVLRPADLSRASGIWLANSVRGMVEVRIMP